MLRKRLHHWTHDSRERGCHVATMSDSSRTVHRRHPRACLSGRRWTDRSRRSLPTAFQIGQPAASDSMALAMGSRRARQGAPEPPSQRCRHQPADPNRTVAGVGRGRDHRYDHGRRNGSSRPASRPGLATDSRPRLGATGSPVHCRGPGGISSTDDQCHCARVCAGSNDALVFTHRRRRASRSSSTHDCGRRLPARRRK